ncbi:hypothetical protein COLO4_07754 [Corchorus olitorius]|uniref:25S rRNA (uridine-N(3))-methyltransferase BMT5-like domain-containing protein n=1 Tax=Corchorus olitorius TaxID=93759 RepID=A0A1R3KIP7_9ROSI|nr:hypothetical protein COLO4_07754 [Corchorus olitorius]
MGQMISFFRKCFGRQKQQDLDEEQDPYENEYDQRNLDLFRDNTVESSSFCLHQNVISTCIDIVEDSASASACGLGVGNRQLETPERWIKHYCSSQRMLLVGEGDFSFSACLALAFGSATNMIATSLDSRGFLFRNYKKAMSNIHDLRSRGCTILHGVDVTEMANHCSLMGIQRHQLLLSLFFQNAKKMINEEDGEIHVTHKSNGFFLGWNLQLLASGAGLKLIQELPFNFTDYPGYRTKYGFGGDKNFNCHPSKTYKFALFRPSPTPTPTPP